MDQRLLTTSKSAPLADRGPPRTNLIRWLLKWTVRLLGLTLMLLPALTCAAEARLSRRQDVFVFWGQLFAVIPGLPGKYLRKCYYFLTLRKCTLHWEIGFLSYFTDRRAEVGRGVYIGAGSYLATVVLGDGCLVGSRVSILSGKHQHHFGPDGRLTVFDPASVEEVRVGEQTWIGEGAVLMADVGSRCIVAAGSVVSSPVPDGCKVGGNPARFVAKTGPWADAPQER